MIVRRSRNVSPTVYRHSVRLNFSSIVVSNSLNRSNGAPVSCSCGTDIAHRIIGVTRTYNISMRNRVNYLNDLRANVTNRRSNSKTRNVLSRRRLLADTSRTRRFIGSAGISTLTVTVNADRNTCGFAHPPANSVLSVRHMGRVRTHVPGARLIVRNSSSIPRR